MRRAFMYHIIESPEYRSEMSFRTASDESLVAAARSGGYSAYAELCRRYRESVFRTVQRITRNKEDAEDALQDSWMKAFINISRFQGKSAFSTWLTRIAINSALMILRKRRWHKETSLDDPSDSDDSKPLEIVEPSHNPEETYIRRETQIRVQQAVKGLPPNLRRVIEIRQAQDGSVEEIARMTGISIYAAKSRLHRARLALQKPLKRI
jgi:RNA polymerase sigma factor (sigma-70 family)